MLTKVNGKALFLFKNKMLMKPTIWLRSSSASAAKAKRANQRKKRHKKFILTLNKNSLTKTDQDVVVVVSEEQVVVDEKAEVAEANLKQSTSTTIKLSPPSVNKGII